jgi:hypothetical protein
MRHLILPVLIVLAFGACSPYQYLTLDSSQLSKNDKKQFVWENDTLRLSYDFSGPGGPMSVNIYNKSSQPLYINWKKSALIRDEHSVSLFDPNVTMTGTANSVGYRVGRFTASSSNFTASLALPEGIDFIPPSSAITKYLLPIGQSGSLVSYVADSIPKEKLTDAQGIYVAKYQRLTYNEDQSPIRFKSYMTFTLGNNSSVEFSETHSFYVGEVVQTSASPETFNLYQQEGDKLFIKRPSM